MWGPASYATPSSLSGTDTERRNREIPRTSRPWGRPNREGNGHWPHDCGCGDANDALDDLRDRVP